MRVLRGRQPGAKIEELPDSRFPRQVAHGAAEERPVGPHSWQYGRVGGDYLLRGFAVDGEMILSAEPVIVYPSGMRDAGIQRDLRISR
jgi:hypothetical protein